MKIQNWGEGENQRSGEAWCGKKEKKLISELEGGRGGRSWVFIFEVLPSAFFKWNSPKQNRKCLWKIKK